MQQAGGPKKAALLSEKRVRGHLIRIFHIGGGFGVFLVFAELEAHTELMVFLWARVQDWHRQDWGASGAHHHHGAGRIRGAGSEAASDVASGPRAPHFPARA